MVEVTLTPQGVYLWEQFGGPEETPIRKLRVPMIKLMTVFGEFFPIGQQLFENDEIRMIE